MRMTVSEFNLPQICFGATIEKGFSLTFMHFFAALIKPLDEDN